MRLFHYTSLESLDKILASRTIRFQHARHMNDGLEVVWILEVINRFIAEENPERREVLAQAFEHIQIRPVFLFCMSELENQLSLWTRYANDGKGVVLGFDLDSFLVPREIPNQSVHSYNSFGLFKCEYDLEVQRQAIKKYHSQLQTTNDESYQALVDLSISCKNPGFSEEGEWRIADMVFEEARVYEGDVDTINTRISSDKLIQYIDVPFENLFKAEDPIASIRIGPLSTIHHDDIRRHIAPLLRNKNALPEVFYSRIPYRGKD